MTTEPTEPAGAAPGRPGRMEERRFALPTWRLLLGVGGSAAACAAGWPAIAIATGFGPDVARSGAFGAALVGVVVLASVLVMTPWVRRPVTSWMTFWLGSMVLRVLVTPAGAFLLYSAAPLEAEPLALAVALTYLVTLLVEAALLAGHVRRETERPRD